MTKKDCFILMESFCNFSLHQFRFEVIKTFRAKVIHLLKNVKDFDSFYKDISLTILYSASDEEFEVYTSFKHYLDLFRSLDK